tara:strand:+ start:92 stop:472 length:381 start_codon:yes stop_codon:yes gene_type:complete
MWKFDSLIKNFRQEEMACSCCNVSAMSEDFMVKLQELRDKCGFALPVNSGYRCASHNKKSGGHPNSGHLTGEAADLRVERTEARIVIQLALEMGFSVGIQQKGEGRFVHVDTKPRHTGKPNLWSYA